MSSIRRVMRREYKFNIGDEVLTGQYGFGLGKVVARERNPHSPDKQPYYAIQLSEPNQVKWLRQNSYANDLGILVLHEGGLQLWSEIER